MNQEACKPLGNQIHNPVLKRLTVPWVILLGALGEFAAITIYLIYVSEKKSSPRQTDVMNSMC